MGNLGYIAAPSDKIRDLEQKNYNLDIRNNRLVEPLRDSRNKLELLRQDMRSMLEPPNTYDVFLKPEPEKGTAKVFTENRRIRLWMQPEINERALQLGAQMRLNEGSIIVGDCGYSESGDIANVREVLPDWERTLASDTHDEEFVVLPAGDLSPKPEDSVMIDRKSGYALEVIPKPEVKSLVPEEVPDVTYADIGGLDSQVEQIHDAMEMPFLQPELFEQYNLHPLKDVLLYGPPGNGKTLIIKAMANPLVRKITPSRGKTEAKAQRAWSCFLNVKGPEPLNRFMGETERQIRLIFDHARDIAEDGEPVIVFFDEIDSIFCTRDSDIFSDMGNTVVPQLLNELDGVEGLENVIVIGATSREETIDPAILRPGRLDVEIHIEHLNEAAAKDIFRKYSTPELSYNAAEVEAHGGVEQNVSYLINQVIERMYAKTEESEYVQIHYADSTSEVMYYRDFSLDAVISNIVNRAKRSTVKLVTAGGEAGISSDRLLSAVAEELAQSEDLSNTSNPDGWARISGRPATRVASVEVIRHG